ncbi:phosphotransferase system, enzyme I, PtsP [Trichlorobacter thiogenes]|uniref:phosphoenolpyruvate--protein phosphotransferase n=1 Tax=Trichlorobacter thiogenes TaxID=115783 RepID=A0A1T4PXA7_9BACT|nr:phosphoenolpyruvate--protein phosphotransferase [Trichlorobacter thiogenes]SJZ96190.1 phosphotransferase system, enzyme I, PtsP [Trichlorobacter thiogenes]
MQREQGQQSLGLRTLEDISSIILHSHDLQETLDNIVTIVAKRMASEVCSIYLLEDDGETLVLKATKGLSKSAVGTVSMKTSEGLSGLVVQTRDMVTTDNAPAHPRYKYFKHSKEERYLSFLGLPLFERKTPIGVIVVQTVAARSFTLDEISILRTITFQISSIVLNAKLLDSIQTKEQERAYYEQELARLKTHRPGDGSRDQLETKAKSCSLGGTAVSPGFSHGKVYILDRFSDKVIKVAKVGSVADELHKFRIALEKVTIQTIYMEKRVSELLSEDDASIFHTHLMILEDRGFLNKVNDLIEQGSGATRAVHEVVQGYIEVFSAMEDPYLRERSADMEDIGRRIIDVLEGNEHNGVKLKEKRVIVAEDIFPSDMAMLDHDKILGIATEKGNIYSHAAIMAKSLGIPAVVGVKGLLHAANVKDQVIVDGTSGHIYLNPEKQVRDEYLRLEKEYTTRLKELEPLRDLPAVTSDGTRIQLRANIGLLSDVRTATANGAEGVGLYRTEFPYMARTSFPNRQEQALLYRKILEGFPGQPVNIRTLDIGGDKGLPYFSYPHEDNPFLGWRSIRVSLDEEAIFREQLAGILLAAPAGQATIMFPLISCLDEVRRIRAILDSVVEELCQQGHDVCGGLPLGIMVEVPAAVQIIDRLAAEVDYLSIGTNDLIQYMLAADRNNIKVKQYYEPYHPAVLHAIKRVADVGHKMGKKVSVCGEMAADPLNALLLVGMGVREFSLSAPSIPLVKQAIRTHSLRLCQAMARKVLSFGTACDIKRYLSKRRKELFE